MRILVTNDDGIFSEAPMVETMGYPISSLRDGGFPDLIRK